MTSPATCATCRWMQSNRECRRFPPYAWSKDLKVIPEYGVVSGGPVWPKVNDCDWCGEHAPKEAA